MSKNNVYYFISFQNENTQCSRNMFAIFALVFKDLISTSLLSTPMYHAHTLPRVNI